MANQERVPRVLILGAGYAGLYAACRLQSKLRSDEASVTVVDPRPYMTYQSLLPEAGAGTVEPRHVVAPLRALLPKCQVLSGHVIDIDPEGRSVTVRMPDENIEHLGYDLLVLSVGSVSKVFPVPGLADQAVGFSTLEEAVYLRNHVLSRLDQAASTLDPERRAKFLTFMFVGGGFAGIEALGEIEDMARFAVRRYYPAIDPSEMRWVLVEAADRIMPEVSRSLADYAVEVLRQRGIDIRMETMVDSLEDGHVALSDGTEFDAGTVVWTTGVEPEPVVSTSVLPQDSLGRVACLPSLQVEGWPAIFAAGDCAAIPDPAGDEPDATCPPTAQHAVRQGKLVADNIRAVLRGKRIRRFTYRSPGSVATLGLHQGVAEVYGWRLKGWPAWALHRAYHLSQLPTANRKARVLADWLLDAGFPRQAVALGELHAPRREFVEQARR
ncbi:NAD(P)/FAD-dependent oxidoreductase [Actinobacteria bacterium YIM 96077]|uniref:NAD(P)/FAD-dependent oxidoreductase n=2 Tax=Phytoactinopolyspora halophila TaxID=1981511 RepID=A0A329R390_9ACTN|nr:NAD(P)/FAD-dependent oxidoreductase [Actinobacteria bacterium YIM 96077]RAW19001.1 NAD(P)/FAD-dependent oxidoreductase [Phytoactinopolyspora halophila]